MNKELFIKKLEELRNKNKKRNFTQTLDVIFNLKNIDPKKEENKIDTFITLPKSRGKDIKICAFVDKALIKQASEVCDKVIPADEFPVWGKDKKAVKKLAREYDFFIAQANLMPQVAKIFGRYLGPRGKMPNPKAGCVIPPDLVNLKPIVDKLKKTVRLQIKTEPSVKVAIGTEAMSNEDLAENFVAVYSALVHDLPNHEANISQIILKFTMSSPVKLIEKGKKKNES